MMNVKLCSVYRHSKYLAPTHPLTLCTMDLATEDIQETLVNAERLNRNNRMPFFQEIFILLEYGSFFSTISYDI